MIETSRRAPATARGLWCNLCGSRLASLDMLRPTPRWARKPAGTGPRAEGEHTWSICEQCYRKRLRCEICRVQIGSRAFVLDGDSRFYCRECFENHPHCDTCDRPISGRGLRTEDGELSGRERAEPVTPAMGYPVPAVPGPRASVLRTQSSVLGPQDRNLCERCRSTAVTDPNAAHALYGRMRAALSRQIGMALHEPCQLKLVSRHQLMSLVDKSLLYNLDADSRGRCFGLFMRQGAHRSIFIESGLPQIVLLEVMAHEYAHAWQSENCREAGSREVQEGFAEWVAYKLLQYWGCKRRSDRMLRRDDLYGRGLKMVLAWEAEGGVAEVFRRTDL
jgi:hypothetical protein